MASARSCLLRQNSKAQQHKDSWQNKKRPRIQNSSYLVESANQTDPARTASPPKHAAQPSPVASICVVRLTLPRETLSRCA